MNLTSIRTFFISLLLASSSAYGQNLIPNPGFEDYSNCPDSISQLNKATPWETPTWGTPDYYNSCSGPCDYVTPGLTPVCIPENIFGFQETHEGEGYAGFYSFRHSDNYREYLQTPLSSAMQSGQVYTVTIQVSLADHSYACATDFGIAFTNTEVDEAHFYHLSSISVDLQSPLITDSVNWTELTWDYTATGNENYMIIGNFNDNAQTTTTMGCANWHAYYFIDGVGVVQKDLGIDTFDQHKLSIFPNPSEGIVQIHQSSTSPLEINLITIDGKFLGSFDLSGKESTVDLSAFPPGSYFLNITDGFTIKNYRIDLR